MTSPQCDFPGACPVPDPDPVLVGKTLLLHAYPSGIPFRRVYATRYGYGEFNPGSGQSRFAPLERDGDPIPTLYGANTSKAALLETIFHDVAAPQTDRLIHIADLRDHGLAYLNTPMELRLIDLRDDALANIGLERRQLVSTPASHYPCTQQWAASLHAATSRVDPLVHGIIWYSRQAELTGQQHPEEVFMLFGDRVPTERSHLVLSGPGVRNLVEGRGRLKIEAIAEELGATIVHEL